MARTRNKIRYCYEDYMKHISIEEKQQYQLRYAPLVSIISETESDKEIMAQAKAYDAEHGTDMFSEAVHIMVYCIACHKMDCDC